MLDGILSRTYHREDNVNRLGLTLLSIVGMMGVAPVVQAREAAPVTLACTDNVIDLRITLLLDMDNKVVLNRDTILARSNHVGHFENTPMQESDIDFFWDQDLWNDMPL